MEELELGGGRVVFDAEATRAATARLHAGAAELCGCVGCREYLAVRAALLPRELRELLARLGCDPDKEWELVPLARGPGTRREVLASWRFVGEVQGETEAGGVRFRPGAADQGTAGGARVEVELDFEVAADRTGSQGR